MTRHEKIMTALEWLNNESTIRVEVATREDGSKVYDLRTQVPYKDAKAILREFPDCCHIYASDTAKTEHPSENVRGEEGTIVLDYIGQYVDRRTGRVHTTPVRRYINVNHCR